LDVHTGKEVKKQSKPSDTSDLLPVWVSLIRAALRKVDAKDCYIETYDGLNGYGEVELQQAKSSRRLFICITGDDSPDEWVAHNGERRRAGNLVNIRLDSLIHWIFAEADDDTQTVPRGV
jgi:hypothetical protein